MLAFLLAQQDKYEQRMLEERKLAMQQIAELQKQREEDRRRHEELIERLREKQNPDKSDDPVEEFKNQLLLNRLQYQPPSVKQQFEEAKGVFEALNVPIGGQNSETVYEWQWKEKNAELAFEKYKLERQTETELAKSNQLAESIKSVGAMLAGLAGIALQKGNVSPPPTQSQATLRAVCTNADCRHEVLVPAGNPAPSCEKCGSEMLLAGEEA